MSTYPPARDGVRRILHVDCDAFFVQVARLEDPEGAGRASLLIVGGRSGRGVVTSASYEARRFGVHSAMPMARALRLCPRATVVPVPREACGRRSRAVRRVLEDRVPVVQPASIDEFYLDLTGTERLFRGEPLEATATRLRETILEHTDISVSIGAASNRLVAKMATGRAKPAGVHVVDPGEEAAFMRTFELREIPGVGPALLERLTERGIETVEDALRIDEYWLEQWLGDRRGRWLWRRIRGIDETPVDPREPRKSISSERTFFEDIADGAVLEEMLLSLVVSVCATLRRDGLRARTVTVKLRDGDFTTRQSSRTLPEPVEADRVVYETALELLGELRAARPRPSRLLGVGLTNFDGRGGASQMGLFPDTGSTERETDRKVSRAVDELRERFGKEAVLPGRIVKSDDENDDVGDARDDALDALD